MRAAWTARSTRRIGAAAVSGSMLAAMLLGSPVASAAPLGDPTKPNLDAASAYLVDQLTDGTHYASTAMGVTIDAALALAATGRDDAALGAITAWVATNSGEYTFIGTPYEQYVSGGEVGKVALLAEVTGNDPHNFGGVDLLGVLNGLECTAPDTNVSSPCAGAGNYSGADNIFKQSLGVLAQARAGEASAAPIQFLLSLQLPTGAWSSALDPAGPADIDSTAMAAMALTLDPSDASRAAVASALAWIADQQASSGGFPGVSADSTNTAGLAIQALRLDATTYDDVIVVAETALALQQNVDGGFDISVGTPGSDVRATAQSAGGAAGIPFGSLLRSVPALTAADDAAQFLVDNLVDGTHYNFEGGTYPDDGLTSDALFALVAHGGHAATVTSIADFLATEVDNYADPTSAFGGPYSGGLSKLSLVAEATGRDPHAFGGYDLLGLLADNVCVAAAPAAGCTAPGEFINAFSPITQALGVLALQASTDESDHLTIDSPPVVRLSQFQCDDGGFTSALITVGQACTSDVDATGFAVQALAAVPGTDLRLGSAQRYLQAQQSASGAFGGASGVNPDSTAQASIALQVLTESLNAPTAPSTDTAVVPPILAWQAAVDGLLDFTVADTGFGLPGASTSLRVRSTTQAVLAASFGTLVGLSGAPLESAPRIPYVAPVEPPVTPTTDPVTSAPTPAPSVTTTVPDLAATGPEHATSLSLWGAALILVGAGALMAARPLAQRTRRH